MNTKTFIKKYTMVIALGVVFILFAVLTKGRLLYPQNLSNLLLQNAYVLVMACGMLLCILTGGNIDLSVGSTVCLIGAIAAQMLANTGVPAVFVILICLVLSILIGIWQGFWIGNVHPRPSRSQTRPSWVFSRLISIFRASTMKQNGPLLLPVLSFPFF